MNLEFYYKVRTEGAVKVILLSQLGSQITYVYFHCLWRFDT